MNSSDEESVFSVAEKLIGVSQQGQYRKDIIVRNVERRMKDLKINTFLEYLEYAQKNSSEFSRLVSALTIHTTSWFRESPHFEFLKEHIEGRIDEFKQRKFRVLSVACSTGEEVYSLAMVLEGIKKRHLGFDYEVIGIDIDPESIKVGKNGVYAKSYVDDISLEYQQNVRMGKNRLAEYFAISKEVRSKCTFSVKSIMDPNFYQAERFDSVFCRNVLIYFSPEIFEVIVRKLVGILEKKGVVTLGHSEALISPKTYNLEVSWNSSYRVQDNSVPLPTKAAAGLPSSVTKNTKATKDFKKLDPISSIKDKIKSNKDTILVVDDSKTIRAILEKLFTKNGYRVLLAANANEATEAIKNNTVSLISLDIHMPGENGNLWLKRQRALGMKIPAIIVTDASVGESEDVLDALENGAQDYIKKAKLDRSSEEVIERINMIIRKKGKVKTGLVMSKSSKNQKLQRPDIILIGASTGGTEALSKLLLNFNKNSPPVLVVQHISPNFALPFAQRLCDASGLEMGEYKDGTQLKRGHLYMSRGNIHIGARYTAGLYRLALSDGPPQTSHRPSVDTMFESILKDNLKAACVLLTGMGKDGAAGLFQLKQKGAMTFAQDEASCVVFGMPGVAINMGAAGFVGNIPEIRAQLDSCIGM